MRTHEERLVCRGQTKVTAVVLDGLEGKATVTEGKSLSGRKGRQVA